MLCCSRPARTEASSISSPLWNEPPPGDHGAVGVIDRSEFSHWGAMLDTEGPDYLPWVKGAAATAAQDLKIVMRIEI